MDSLCFILLHVQTQRSHAPNRKLVTYFLCRFATLQALGQCLRTVLFCHNWHGYEHSQEVSWNSTVTLDHSQHIAEKGTGTLISLSSCRVAIALSSLHYFFTFKLWLVIFALEQNWKNKLNQQSKQNSLNGYLNPSASTLTT